MAEIEVKITIPDYEYKEWDEYNKKGIEGVKDSFKSDLNQRLKQDGIRHFEIEISHSK